MSSRFGILYESTFATGPEMAVEATPPLAAQYERVHFIGHAQYNPSISEYGMKDKAEAIQADLQSRTSYAVLLVDIKVTHYPPTMTDVDFVLDVPVESPIAPLVIAVVIVALAVILAYIVWLFWSTWVEKVRTYYCDQETPPTAFDGWDQYVAHLAEAHPTKYQAVEKAQGTPWWETVSTTVKWGVVGVVAAGVLSIAIAVFPRREQGGERY